MNRLDDPISPHTPTSVPDDWCSWKQQNEHEKEAVARPSLSYFKDAWKRLVKNKLAMSGLILLIVLAVMAMIGPFLSPLSVKQVDLPNQLITPSCAHWFGTDTLGRDVYTRTWYGARFSLFGGLRVACIGFFIGISYGGIS